MSRQGRGPSKIAFVANDLAFLLSHRLEIVRASAAVFTDVIALAPRSSEPPPMEIPFRFLPLPYAFGRSGVMALVKTALMGMAFALRSSHTVFHLISIIPILTFGFPLSVVGRPVVYALSGMGTVFSSDHVVFRLVRPIICALYVFMFNRPTARVIVQNADDAQFLKGLGVKTERIVMIRGSGADGRRFPFCPKPQLGAPPVILVPARLIKEKGIEDAATVSANLDRAGVAHQVWIAGGFSPGNPHGLSAANVQAIEARCPNVRFLGLVSDMAAVLARADIVCFPSYREGLPKAIIEAFATGRPVIGYDTVGVREIVRNDVTGLLVPLRSTEDLTSGVLRLLLEPDLRSRLMAAAYADFQASFAVDLVVHQTLKVYAGLLGQINAGFPSR